VTIFALFLLSYTVGLHLECGTTTLPGFVQPAQGAFTKHCTFFKELYTGYFAVCCIFDFSVILDSIYIISGRRNFAKIFLIFRVEIPYSALIRFVLCNVVTMNIIQAIFS